MPRPNKKIDEICALLEMATVNISFMTALDEPIVEQRVQQAIDRHPDLRNLLHPIFDELKVARTKEYRAKAFVATARSLIKKIFDN